MRLVLEWGVGEWEDAVSFTVPFEWSSPEDLYAVIQTKKEEHRAIEKAKLDLWKALLNSKITEQDWQDQRRPLEVKPIVDVAGREIRIENMTDYSCTWADVEIFTLDEWFEQR